MNDSLFSNYGIVIPSPQPRKNGNIPFKNHPQFSILADILSRKQLHHVQIKSDFSENLYPYFFESLMIHLHQTRIPSLHNASLVYLDSNKFLSTNRKQKIFEAEFLRL